MFVRISNLGVHVRHIVYPSIHSKNIPKRKKSHLLAFEPEEIVMIMTAMNLIH